MRFHVFESLLLGKVKITIRKMLGTSQKSLTSAETIQQFIARRDLKFLQGIFSESSQV